MAKKKTPGGKVNKGGRPPKKVSAALVKRLASVGCTADEVAIVCECSRSLIYEKYGTAFELGKADLKRKLRHKQVQMALSGNPAMLIWLGKNLLDQKDKQDIEVTGRARVVMVEEIVDAADDNHQNGQAAPDPS